METKQIVPRKHIGKSMTAKQEMMVEQIQKDLNLRTMAEAKHQYFENQKKYDDRQGTKIVPIPGTPEEEGDIIAVIEDAHKRIPELPRPRSMAEMAEDTEMPKKKATMTIAETKLGVTMVLSKEECKELGIVETKTTKEAIQEIRAKLGLPEKKKMGE